MSAEATILVIEDNAQNRYLLRYILENEGYEVVEAHTGREALELVEGARPNLILLDIQLPEMDGYEVARRLRVGGLVDSVPIIAVTSYAMVGDRERILEAGCDAYVEKPIDPASFATTVRELLTREG